ncbi:MAG: IS3 family transposase [Lachnospiraceae bacterium]
MSSAEPTKSKNETPIYRLKLFPFSTRTGKRYGVRRVHRELLNRGFLVNHKRVQREL